MLKAVSNAAANSHCEIITILFQNTTKIQIRSQILINEKNENLLVFKLLIPLYVSIVTFISCF